MNRGVVPYIYQELNDLRRRRMERAERREAANPIDQMANRVTEATAIAAGSALIQYAGGLLGTGVKRGIEYVSQPDAPQFASYADAAKAREDAPPQLIRRPRARQKESRNYLIQLIGGPTIVTTSVFTADYPCTLTGFRWTYNASDFVPNAIGTNNSMSVQTVLAIQKSGTTNSWTNPVAAQPASIIPHKNSISTTWLTITVSQTALGGAILGGPTVDAQRGSTNIKRKLQKGDTLLIYHRVIDDQLSAYLYGTIEFFIKT
jgi:hypothetical protein